jgi:hypothetical protein
MKVVCAWCKREGLAGVLGERAPFDDATETHGICRRHVERVLEQLPASSFPDVRMLIVVAAREPKLRDYLEESFAAVADVRVIADRRRSDRRRLRADAPVDRRRGERRQRMGRRSPLGYQVVRFGKPTRPAPAPPL